MEQLKSKPLRGYKKIVRLGEKMENQVHSFYKYMNAQRAIEFLESGDYYFVEPIEWADPYEKRFYTADYSSLRYTPKQCFCTCLTHKISSEAAWKMYRNNNGGLADRTIRFEFNRKTLFKALEDNISIEKIYFGNVNYEYTTKEISELHHLRNPTLMTSPMTACSTMTQTASESPRSSKLPEWTACSSPMATSVRSMRWPVWPRN